MVFIPTNSADFRFRRSALFMPASNERALKKAPTLKCDCIIFDLEDAVGNGERGVALKNLKEFVKDTHFQKTETIIRTSPADSKTFAVDLAIAAECGVDAVLLPKVETAKAINTAEVHLKSSGCDAAIWAMIETPMGLVNLREIVEKNSSLYKGGLKCLVVGPNDLAKATGIKPVKGRPDLHPLMMQVIATARAYGMSVLDGVYNDFKDVEGLQAECLQGSNMGFDGKTLIHPSQIEVANKAFSPSKAELEEARKIVEAFGMAKNVDKGVIQIDGKMVERLHLIASQTLLTFFD